MPSRGGRADIVGGLSLGGLEGRDNRGGGGGGGGGAMEVMLGGFELVTGEETANEGGGRTAAGTAGGET